MFSDILRRIWPRRAAPEPAPKAAEFRSCRAAATLETVGDRLRFERIRLGFNQTDFGALGGVTKHAQIHYEKNKRAANTRYLAAVAHAGVDVGFVITGHRSEQPIKSMEVA